MNIRKYIQLLMYRNSRSIKNLIKPLEEEFSSYPIPHPRIIHIETRTRCNSTCSFCPANYNENSRDDLFMEDNLVYKILNELKEIDFMNRVFFYNNNEPFLDKRIFEFIKRAREALPKGYLELKSNGRGLKIDKILEVFHCGLDTLYINDYTDTPQHSKNVKKIRVMTS